MTSDQADRLALEIRGIADSILAVRDGKGMGMTEEVSYSILFSAELHLLRIAKELEA